MIEGLSVALRRISAEWVEREDPALTLLDSSPQQVASRVLKELQGVLDCDATSCHVREALNDQGFVHLKGAFALSDELCDTPIWFLPFPELATTTRLRLSMLGANALLGKDTVSYGSENEGALFVNLVGLPGDGRVAEKSRDGMRGHTDAVSFPFPGRTDPEHPQIAPSPDLVCLAALRNPNHVPTKVIPLTPVLRDMESCGSLLQALKEPHYFIACQGTFSHGTEAILRLDHPHSVGAAEIIIPGRDGADWVRFSHSKVTFDPDSPSAQLADQALQKFKSLCAEQSAGIVLEPGDVLLINNRRALHGRGEVGAGHGGTTRWIVRTYALTHADAQGHFYPGSSFKLQP